MTRPLRMLVLGHSDSDGTRLTDSADAWPQVVARELPGLSIELTHRILFPGQSATKFVEKELAAGTPDIVVVAVSSFSAAFAFVSNRLRDLLGDRAASVAIRLEHLAGDLSVSNQRLHQATIAPRRAARRLVGTRPTSTLEATLDAYRDVFQRLAREEDVQTIVLGGAGYTLHHERMNPGMRVITERFDAELLSAAQGHHFDWVSHAGVMGGRGTKERFFMSDGIHTDEAGQRLVADSMMPLIGSRWGGA
ncbi:MAG: hypothetical protein ABI782_05100 [Anaerolineaceae bacterium]